MILHDDGTFLFGATKTRRHIVDIRIIIQNQRLLWQKFHAKNARQLSELSIIYYETMRQLLLLLLLPPTSFSFFWAVFVAWSPERRETFSV